MDKARNLGDMNQRRAFTLLEVLIALALVALALPLLIAPFLYTARDFQENVEKLKMERVAQWALTSLLADLHQKKIATSMLEGNQTYPIPSPWFQEVGIEAGGTYIFTKKQPERAPEAGENNIELWEVMFAFPLESQKKEATFSYLFIVIREEKGMAEENEEE